MEREFIASPVVGSLPSLLLDLRGSLLQSSWPEHQRIEASRQSSPTPILCISLIFSIFPNSSP
ncbi:hypothetical protein ACLOJK_005324 [Asimina triloba]